jgi:CTP:molybdopterin cytidylyltransferase MocA
MASTRTVIVLAAGRGSRFAADGRVLEGPATSNLKARPS